MGKTINQLKDKWNKEKDFYKSQEVGTGVQSFVKDVLESEELFNLKEGKLSKEDIFRKEEFIHEKRTKNHRRGDFVIFINPEIVIPIEVECYGSIEKGKNQLRAYQNDLNLKYGILTDGFTWRFYNDNIPIKGFSLSEIFSDPSLFIDFWKEYIKLENYYLSFFEEKGQLFLFKNALFAEEHRETFFEDITNLIKSFRNKLKIEGYFKGLTKKENAKKATEITYAYIIQFILYKTLVDNAFEEFEDQHKENVKKIYEYIKESRYKDILSIIDRISPRISENIYRPFKEEQKAISPKIFQLYRNENRLSDVSPWLDIFIFINKYNFQNVRNEIFGFIYENYLKELYAEEKRGQYFTDSAVVNFMLQQIGYTAEEIKKKIESGKLDKLSIIDPACGSGTFLYKATDEIIKSFSLSDQMERVSKQIEGIVTNNVFGLDIEEFPLYLAEMNIIMRMLTFIMGKKYNNPVDKKIKVFLTKDTISEFLESPVEKEAQIRSKELEPEFFSFVRDKDDLKEMKESLGRKGEIPRRRFDYVIANPPYISYNECCKQNVLIFELIKKGNVKLNNIYGVNLHSRPNNRKKYPPKPNIYAFFISLGLALLKDNAKLCYIIPQTILTAGDLDVLRHHLAKYVTIEKIITFKGNLFINRGLKQQKTVPTSSLIFIIKNILPVENHEIEIINYKDDKDTIEDLMVNIMKGQKIDRKKIPQVSLFENVVNWNLIKKESVFLEFYENYKKNTEDLSIYYEHRISKSRFRNKYYFDVGFILNKNEILNKIEGDCYEVLDFKNFEGYSRFKAYKYYPKDDSKIGLTKNSQGYITLSQKYKVLWSVKNPERFHFLDKPIIFHMGKSSIICSNDLIEIFYIFSLLNSKTNSIVLKGLLLTESEKDFLVPIKAIKEYARVPKISKDNQHIKEEIVKRTKEMINLEKKTLSDFVDFSEILMQRFKEVKVEKGYLLLIDGDKTKKLKIKYNPKLVANVLSREFESDKIKFENEKIHLSYLRNIPIIDFEKQKELKDYIDHLVFSLYFNIPLEKAKFSEFGKIKRICSKNKYYATL